MPIEVADLVATIRADLSGLTAGLNTANTQVKSFAAQAGSNLSGFSNSAGASFNSVGQSAKAAGSNMNSFFTELKAVTALATAGLAALGGLAVGLFEITRKANEASGALYDMSVKTGVAVPVLSALKFGAEESGISFSRVGVAITQFEKKILSAAEGSKSAQADLARFNLTNAEMSAALTGNVTPALEKVLDRIGQMPAGAAKAGAEMKAFGRSGADLGVIMQNAGGDIEDFMVKLQALGGLMSTEGAEKAKVFNNALFTLETEFAIVGRVIAEEVGPVIVKAIQIITEWFTRNQETVHDWAKKLGDFAQAALFTIVHFASEGRKAFAYFEEGVSELGSAAQLFADLAAAAADSGSAVVHATKAIALAMSGDLAGAATESGMAFAAVTASYEKAKNAMVDLGKGFFEATKARKSAIQDAMDDRAKWMAMAAGFNVDNLLSAPAVGDHPDLQTKTAKAKNAPNDGSDALVRAQESLARTLADMKLKAFKAELEDERSELEKSFSNMTIDYRQYYEGLTTLANKQFNEERSDQAEAINQMLLDRQKLAARAARGGNSKEINAANEAMLKIDEQIARAMGKLDDAYSSNEKEVTKWSRALTAAQKEMIKGSNEAAVALMEAMGGDSGFQGQRDALVNAFAELDEKLKAAAKNADPAAIAWIKSAEALVRLKIATMDVNQATQAFSNAQAQAAADEGAIRRQISLGQITDQQATAAMIDGRHKQIAALTALIAKEKERYVQAGANDPAVLAAIKAQENELNKLKDVDMSPLGRFFKGLRDNTKTFQEEFGDALQTLGQSIKQTLGSAFNSLFHGDVKGFFHGLVSGFQDALAQMAAALLASQLTKLLANILGSVLGGLAGGIGGGIGGLGTPTLGGAAGGMHFASGGILPAGQSGIFGENGPERFISLPGGGTRVFSNPSTKNGSNVTHVHNWNINTPDAQSFMGKESQTMIQRRLSQTVNKGRKVS